MKTEIQMLESQLIYLKLEKAETMNEILIVGMIKVLKEHNKVLEKYNTEIQMLESRIELLKKQSQ